MSTDILSDILSGILSSVLFWRAQKSYRVAVEKLAKNFQLVTAPRCQKASVLQHAEGPCGAKAATATQNWKMRPKSTRL